MKTTQINFDQFIFSESFIKPISEALAKDLGLMNAMLNSANETSNWFILLENAFLADNFEVFEDTLRLGDSAAIYNPTITKAINSVKLFYIIYQQILSNDSKYKKSELIGEMGRKIIRQKNCIDCDMISEVLNQYDRLQNAEELEKFQNSVKMLISGLIQQTAEQFQSILLQSSEILLPKKKVLELF